MYATSKQLFYIVALASKRGLNTVEAAAQEYGFDPGHILTSCDASQLIDWLKKEISPSYRAASILSEKRASTLEHFCEALRNAKSEEERAAIRAAGQAAFERELYR